MMPPRGCPGGAVLRREETARQDRPAVVLQNRDAVDLAIDVGGCLLGQIDVPDIDRPVLMPPLRREGHPLRCLRLRGRAAEAVELAVQCEDAPASAQRAPGGL